MNKDGILVKTHKYDLGAICPPNKFGGQLVKLKNEFVFAKYSLEVQEQRLLFNAMSHFDINPFLKDKDVQDELQGDASARWDFSKVTQSLTDSYYSFIEKRTIILPVREILRTTGSRNYKALDKAIKSLQSRTMVVDEMTSKRIRVKKTINPIEVASKVGKTDILITFTKEFMPYLLALSGYQAIDLNLIAGFSYKHSSRYYHWCLYALNMKENESLVKFDVSIDRIRERLEIGTKEHQRNFFSRVVKKSVDEINEKTPIFIKVDKVIKKDNKGRNLRGNPVSRLTFNVYRDKAAALDAAKHIVETCASRYNSQIHDSNFDKFACEDTTEELKKERDTAEAELRRIELLIATQNESTMVGASALGDVTSESVL
ncbi:replication initiation protein [Vibrio parahaemolyticus]|nr:RepB family plasmid replication initiator protein [Vibrio parahaemolyticus]